MHELHFTQQPKDLGLRRKPDSEGVDSQDIIDKPQEARPSRSADTGADTAKPVEFNKQETIAFRDQGQIVLQRKQLDGNLGKPFNPDVYVPESEIADWIPASYVPRMEKGETPEDYQGKIFGHLPEGLSGPEHIPIPKFITITSSTTSTTEGKPRKLKYEVKEVVGKGGMGLVVQAEPTGAAGKTSLDESVVIKLVFDKGKKHNNQRILRENALQAVLNPDQASQSDLAWNSQFTEMPKTKKRRVLVAERGGRSTRVIKDLPKYKGATYFPFSNGNLYATVYEHIKGTGLDKYAEQEQSGEGEEKEKEFARERGGLTPIDTVQMMLPVVNALSEMHALGIVNRDVKPGNMIGSPDYPEETRLIDLGLGKDQVREMLEEDYSSLTLSGEGLQVLADSKDSSPLTKEGSALGTPVYMDREAFNAEADYLSDVHAAALSALHLMDAVTFKPAKKVLRIALNIMETGSHHNELDLDSIPERKRFPSAAERRMIQSLYEAARPRFPERLRALRRKFAQFERGEGVDLKEGITVGEIRALKKYVVSSKTEGVSDTSKKVIRLAESMTGWPDGPVRLNGVQETLVEDFLAQDHFDRYMPLDVELRGMDAVKEKMAQGILARYKELGEEPSPGMMSEINRALGVVVEPEVPAAKEPEVEEPAAAVA